MILARPIFVWILHLSVATPQSAVPSECTAASHLAHPPIQLLERIGENEVRLSEALEQPTLLAMTRKALFVYDASKKILISFNRTGRVNWTRRADANGSPFGNPVSLQVVKDNEVWLVDERSRALSVFSSDGNTVRLVRFEAPVLSVIPGGAGKYWGFSNKTVAAEFDTTGRQDRPLFVDRTIENMNVLRKEAFVPSGDGGSLVLTFMYTRGGFLMNRVTGKVSTFPGLADLPEAFSVRRNQASVSRIDPRRTRLAVYGTADSKQLITVRPQRRGCSWTLLDRRSFSYPDRTQLVAIPGTIGVLLLHAGTLYGLDAANSQILKSWKVSNAFANPTSDRLP